MIKTKKFHTGDMVKIKDTGTVGIVRDAYHYKDDRYLVRCGWYNTNELELVKSVRELENEYSSPKVKEVIFEEFHEEEINKILKEVSIQIKLSTDHDKDVEVYFSNENDMDPDLIVESLITIIGILKGGD